MKKNIIITLGVVAVLILVVAITLIMLPQNNKNNDEDKNIETTTNEASKQDYITYSEWISMLYEEMGITELDSDSEVAFDGEEPVTGEFMALSAMKTVGEAKMQIYLNTDKEITDEIYIDTALKLNLISDSELNEYISHVVAQKIVKNLKSMYYNEFWPDDYEVVEYNENVKEIAEENIVSYDENASSLVISEKFANTLSEGAIIVFTDETTGLKCARKVVAVHEKGVVEVSEKNITLEEVFKSVVVSDVDELTFENIVEYYDIKTAVSNRSIYICEQVGGVQEKIDYFSNEIKSEGYVLELSRDENTNMLMVKITDKATGLAGEMSTNIAVDTGADCSMEIDVEEICVGAQVKYTHTYGVEYADVTVGVKSKFTGSVGLFDTEKIIPLFKTPAPLGNGIVGVDIEIALVLATDGSISFVAEIPVAASVSYDKNNGIKKPTYDIDVDDPHFEGNCSASVSLQLEPTLVILSCIDVIDVQAKMGITASAKIRNQSTKQMCSDVSVSFPVFIISACGGDEKDTLIGALGVSGKWEVISAENAPKKMQTHYEILSDGNIQKVDECTYKEDETVDVDVTVEQPSAEENTTKNNITEIITEEETSQMGVNKEEEDLKTIERVRKEINIVLAEDAIAKETFDFWRNNTKAISLSEILNGDTRLGKALVESIGEEEPKLVAECNELASIFVYIEMPGAIVKVFCSETESRAPMVCETLFDGTGNPVKMEVPNNYDFDGNKEENEKEEITEKEEETTKTENTNSLKTYTTQNISGKGTVFQFDYYGKVTVRDLTNDDLGHFFAEDVRVYISNIRIRYMDIINTTDSIYNDGADYPWIRYISIEKMADTNLKDSNGNKLMIAKLKLDRLENPDTGEVEKATSFLKWQYYAIIPETTEKEYATSRLYDLYTKFSFEYDEKTIYFGVEWDQHYFCTDDYTEDTEEEIISLLSSFRVKE